MHLVKSYRNCWYLHTPIYKFQQIKQDCIILFLYRLNSGCVWYWLSSVTSLESYMLSMPSPSRVLSCPGGDAKGHKLIFIFWWCFVGVRLLVLLSSFTFDFPLFSNLLLFNLYRDFIVFYDHKCILLIIHYLFWVVYCNYDCPLMWFFLVLFFFWVQFDLIRESQSSIIHISDSVVMDYDFSDLAALTSEALTMGISQKRLFIDTNLIGSALHNKLVTQ